MLFLHIIKLLDSISSSHLLLTGLSGGYRDGKVESHDIVGPHTSLPAPLHPGPKSFWWFVNPPVCLQSYRLLQVIITALPLASCLPPRPLPTSIPGEPYSRIPPLSQQPCIPQLTLTEKWCFTGPVPESRTLILRPQLIDPSQAGVIVLSTGSHGQQTACTKLRSSNILKATTVFFFRYTVDALLAEFINCLKNVFLDTICNYLCLWGKPWLHIITYAVFSSCLAVLHKMLCLADSLIAQ